MKVQDVYQKVGYYSQGITEAVPHLLAGVAVLLVFFLLALLAQSFIRKLAHHSGSRRYLLTVMSRAVKTGIIMIGCISALGTLGVNVTAMVTSLGLVGFSLGFALRDLLSNLIAGAMILFYQPFEVGSMLTVGDITGQVREINLRYTVIASSEHQLLVPNANLLNGTIKIKNKNLDS